MQLFVLGATGGTGRELIGQALRRRHRITAFVRNRQKLAAREGLTVVQGDLLNAEALSVALAGHDAVVSAVGPTGLGRTTIMRDSARVAMQAMKAAGVTRLLILSVAVLFDDAGILARALRKTVLRNVADDAAAMEFLVNRSGLEWTIVRPPRLEHGMLTERYAVVNDHLPRGAGGAFRVRRADVAHFMLNEAEYPAHVACVVGISSTKEA
jgi:putative NADH-flavin reductase